MSKFSYRYLINYQADKTLIPHLVTHMLSHKNFEKNVTIMIKEHNVIAIVQKLVITQSYNIIAKLKGRYKLAQLL